MSRDTNVYTLDNNINEQTLHLVENYIDMLGTITTTYTQLARHQSMIAHRIQLLITEIRHNNRAPATAPATDTATDTATAGRQNSGNMQANVHQSSTSTHSNSPASGPFNTRGVSRGRNRARNNERMPRNLVHEIFRARPTPLTSSSAYSRQHQSSTPYRVPFQQTPTQTREEHDNYLFESMFGSAAAPSVSSEVGDHANIVSPTQHFGSNQTSQTQAGNMVLSFERLFPIGIYDQFNRSDRPSSERIFENVPVFPSADQIEQATRTAPFQMIVDPINTSCPITMETFTPEQIIIQVLHCGHIFNHTHLHSWFRNNVRCPVCRHDIRGEPESESSPPGLEPVSPPQADAANGALNAQNMGTLENMNNRTPSFLPRQTNTSSMGDGSATQVSGSPTQPLDNNTLVDTLATILLQSFLATSSTPAATTPTRSFSYSQPTTTNTFPVSWAHLIPSVPLMPINTPNSVATNRDTPTPSSNSTNSVPNANLGGEDDGDSDFLSQD